MVLNSDRFTGRLRGYPDRNLRDHLDGFLGTYPFTAGESFRAASMRFS